MPVDRSTRPNEFADALGQIGDTEPDDDRNESDQVLELGHTGRDGAKEIRRIGALEVAVRPRSSIPNCCRKRMDSRRLDIKGGCRSRLAVGWQDL
jgi:hypothetical protein